jgi:hypothetical protein
VARWFHVAHVIGRIFVGLFWWDGRKELESMEDGAL